MFRMAAYNISDNTKEPLSEDHVKYILRRALDEVSKIGLLLFDILVSSIKALTDVADTHQSMKHQITGK